MESRERRWMTLSEDGHHGWVGRATDPSAREIHAIERGLATKSIAGWLAICQGDYWLGGELTILEVRRLNDPQTPFSQAVSAFLERRRRALEEASSPPSS